MLLLVVFPVTALAQSTITGVVKDSSGAVLPGVTVEAASDALIERVRSVTTDGAGIYRIIDLRPGTYVVSFTLPGFQVVRRDGIVLAAEFTATVNADLRVGEIAEAVVVTGESPIVDITTAVHTQVLDREAIDVLPSGRMIQSIGQLVPGVNLNLPDVGGARAMQQTYMSTHGMTAANNTVMVDGMTINGLQLDGAVQAYTNEAMSQEMSYQTSGIGAETSAGGVRLNLIPREGGNRFSGDLRVSMRPGDWQSSNLTQRHQDSGLETGNAIDRIFDATFSQGGPIMRDKLWFFVSARYNTVNNFITNTFFDDGSPGIDDQYIKQALVRLTWQASPRNKLAAYFDEIDKYRGHDMQSSDDPETAALQWFSPGVSHGPGQVDVDRQQPHADRGRMVEQPRVLHQQLPRRRRAAALFASVVRKRIAQRDWSDRSQDSGDRREHPKPGTPEPAGVDVVRNGRAQLQVRGAISVGRFPSQRRRQC